MGFRKRLITTIILIAIHFAYAHAQNKIVAPPIAVNDSVLIGKNQTIEINVLANDSDPDNNLDSNSINVTGTPQLGIFQIVNKKIRYTPSTNVCGLDSIKYRVRDTNNELSNIATVYITITCFNLAPNAVDDALTLDEDQIDSIDVYDNDFYVDGPDIKISIAENAKHGTASLGQGTRIIYTPSQNYVGLDTIKYSFCDGDLTNELCDSAYIFITVLPINDAPISINDTVDVFQGIEFNFNVGLNDLQIDGPDSNYTLFEAAKNGLSVIDTNGNLIYTATASFTGLDSITYQLCDQAIPNLCSNAKVYFNVNPVFKNPISNNDSLVLATNTLAIEINILKNDSSFFGLNTDSVFFLNNLSNGSFNYDDSVITYSPNTNFIGEEILEYYFKNNRDSTSNVSKIYIICSNRPSIPDQCPIINISGQSTSISIFKNLSIGTKTVDEDFLNIISIPENGSLSSYNLFDNSISYTSNPGFIGLDSFIYVVRDEDRLFSNPVKVCIEVVSDINVTPASLMSPNGDGINDQFTITDIDNYPDNELVIFDRNWNEVHRVKNYSSNNLWTPSENLNGTYFYTLTIRLNNNEQNFKGYFTIVR